MHFIFKFSIAFLFLISGKTLRTAKSTEIEIQIKIKKVFTSYSYKYQYMLGVDMLSLIVAVQM